ncbi:MAG: YkgJ family cysteine cluster protein [Bdellovibrionales bacterium]|nr:YkgJ family cysteine cluster protein [Bdellovibrionales bacterium]
MLLLQGLDQNFPGNSSIVFMLKHEVIINFVLRDYIADAFERMPETQFFEHLQKLLDGVVFFYKKYSQISASDERVRTFHLDVNEIIARNLFGEDGISSQVLCTKGCSDCCSQLVTVSKSEAELLISQLSSSDKLQLARQINLTTDNWIEQLSEEEGKCVFLDQADGSCRVWEDRPANCRNYFVTGSNKHCSVFKRDPDLSRSIKSVYADVCISAFYALDGGEVSMSDYLYEKL